MSELSWQGQKLPREPMLGRDRNSDGQMAGGSVRTRLREKNCRGPSPRERGTSVSFISKGSQVPTVKNRNIPLLLAGRRGERNHFESS